MLDLFRRRDTTLRYFLIGVLSLVAISMVVTLIPGFGTGGGSQSDQTLAKINGEPLTMREVAMRVEQQLRGSGMSRQNAFALANDTYNQLLQQRSVEYLAKKMGFKVTDNDIVEAVKIVVPQLFPNGQFVGKDVYAAFLAQRGMSVPEFESRLRTQLLTGKIGNLIDEGVIISPAEIEAEYHKQNDKIKIEYIAVRQPEIAKQVSVTDADVRAEFDKNKANYKLPEKRSATIFVLDEAKLAATMQPSDADLRRAYEDQKDRFRTPERLKVRHILIKTSEKPAAEVAKLQAKAEDLLKQIKAGGNFAELAKKNSEDTGSAVNGGELGYVVKGQTVKNFEDAAWALKPGELSGVVKTEYGFHILQLQERENARVRPFEEVKAELANETAKQVVFDRMQRNMDTLRADLVKSQNNLPELATKAGAQLIQAPPMTAAEANYPELGSAPELSAQIFALKKGDATSIVQVGGNKLALAVLTGSEPEHPATFEDVQARIRQSLAMRKAAELTAKTAQEVFAKAKAPGADLKKIAAEMKLEYKTAPEFGRNGAAEGVGSGVMFADAFGKPAGYVPNVIGIGDNSFIARVTDSIPADVTKLAADRENIVGQIKQQKSRERAELFQENLVKTLEKESKVKVDQENLKRFLASYSAS